MNLQEIRLDQKEARVLFEEYRGAIRKRNSKEDAAIMQGYRALAKGKTLISLTEAMRRGGLFPSGFPRFAICRADAKMCFADVRKSAGQVKFKMERWTADRETRRYVLTQPKTFDFTSYFQGNDTYKTDAQAMVPIIPPRFRPASALSNFHILWEAEWTMLPPVDPVLLRRLGGDLWAVLASWDLTPLERAVLAGRNTN